MVGELINQFGFYTNEGGVKLNFTWQESTKNKYFNGFEPECTIMEYIFNNN